MRPTLFAVTEQTRLILARLRQLVIGETVPWQELSSLLGQDAQKEGRHYVDSARRVLRRRDRVVCDVVVGVGVKRLTPAEVAVLGHSYIRRLNRAARRGKQKLATLTNEQWSGLTPEQKTAFQLGQGMLGVLANATAPRKVEVVERQLASGNPIPRPDFSAFKNS